MQTQKRGRSYAKYLTFVPTQKTYLMETCDRHYLLLGFYNQVLTLEDKFEMSVVELHHEAALSLQKDY